MIWADDPLDWAQDGASWPNRAASRFVRADGLLWHVQVWERSDAPVALLLHGTGGATHSWRDLAPLLAEHFTVVAPDLPGHAFTQTPWFTRMSLNGMAEALGGLLTALDASPDLIVGHSAGAALACRMTLDELAAPRGIVGVNAALTPFPGAAGVLFPAMAKTLALNPATPRLFAWGARLPLNAERLISQVSPRLDSRGRALYLRLLRSSRHVSGALDMMARWDLPPVYAALPRFQTPMLLIAGTEDRAVPPQQSIDIAARAPRVEAMTLPGLGHLAHEEDPGAVAEAVDAFFARCAEPTSSA